MFSFCLWVFHSLHLLAPSLPAFLLFSWIPGCLPGQESGAANSLWVKDSLPSLEFLQGLAWFLFLFGSTQCRGFAKMSSWWASTLWHVTVPVCKPKCSEDKEERGCGSRVACEMTLPSRELLKSSEVLSACANKNQEPKFWQLIWLEKENTNPQVVWEL